MQVIGRPQTWRLAFASASEAQVLVHLFLTMHGCCFGSSLRVASVFPLPLVSFSTKHGSLPAGSALFLIDARVGSGRRSSFETLVLLKGPGFIFGNGTRTVVILSTAEFWGNRSSVEHMWRCHQHPFVYRLQIQGHA
jgi:hypothetical protein